VSIIVEHEKRKREILERALDVFVEEGYDGTTYQKIADRCGITRTTLYVYFKNKREVFRYTTKFVTDTLEGDFKAVLEDKEMNIADKLKFIISRSIESCAKHSKFLRVIMEYLVANTKQGKDSWDRVRRRTIRLRHVLSQLLILGVKQNELRPMNIGSMNDMIFSIIESAVFQMTVLGRIDIQSSITAAATLIDGLVMPRQPE